MSKPVVAILIQPEWRSQILSAASEADLCAMATIVEPSPGRPIGAEDMAMLLHEATACLTGWGTPPFTEAILVASPKLRLIAHTAGTVRRLVPASVYGSQIRVTHATEAMAAAVAEHVLTQALLSVQGLHRDDQRMREGAWPDRWDIRRNLLGAQTVGIWGLGRVGAATARLFGAFGCRLLGADPTIDADAAKHLGVSLTSLEDLFARSDIVCLLAPLLASTRGLIDAAMLTRLKNGAILINSGRSALVDAAALVEVLRSGRISAAIDVYPTEPPPADHPLRALPNVILSPHVGGHTIETHFRQGTEMVAEIGRFLRGEPLAHEVTAEKEKYLA